MEGKNSEPHIIGEKTEAPRGELTCSMFDGGVQVSSHKAKSTLGLWGPPLPEAVQRQLSTHTGSWRERALNTFVSRNMDSRAPALVPRPSPVCPAQTLLYCCLTSTLPHMPGVLPSTRHGGFSTGFKSEGPGFKL